MTRLNGFCDLVCDEESFTAWDMMSQSDILETDMLAHLKHHVCGGLNMLTLRSRG